jgi:large subunit ribosomal protein L28
MSRVCALTGKKVQFGHNVSHSNRKTNRRFQPNLQKVTLSSEALGQPVPMRISTRALRTVQKKGGLDLFLLKTADKDLAEQAVRLKRRIQKRLATPPAAKKSE